MMRYPPVRNQILWGGDWPFAFLRIHKCACTSVAEALEHTPGHDRAYPISKAQWLEKRSAGEPLPPLVAMIRNPWQRVKSMYSYFVDRGHIPGPQTAEGFERWLLGLTREQVTVEPHFSPQMWQCCEDDEFLPDVVVRWNFRQLEQLFGVSIPHRKPSTPVRPRWTARMLGAAYDLYRDDFDLWTGDR